jgi:outer membrane autotransporter protein
VPPSIRELVRPGGAVVAFLIEGRWTPGTFFPLIRGPSFDAEARVSFTQTPASVGTLSASATFSVPLQAGPDEPDPSPTPPPVPVTPPPDPSHPQDIDDLPLIGPSVATYGVVQPIARQMGLTTLGTLHQRVGDAAADAACLNAGCLNSEPTPPDAVCQNCQQAVWGRLFGQQINNHYEAFADPRASGQIAGIQAGVDLWRGSLIPGHSDTAGLYFAYSNAHVGVDGLVSSATMTAYILEHTGSVNLNAYSVGGYWTHYGPGGWYIDAVLQGSFYSGNAATQFTNLPTNGTGFTSSLEAGYPIPLPWFGPRFVLEPESQIIWQRVSFDDANDGFGTVGLGTTSGASGRLGLRGKWTIDDLAGRVWQPYVLANVWRDWGGDATTMVGPVPVPLLEQATRLEFAGGLSAKILSSLSLYAQVGYQFAVSGTDGGRRDGVRGDLGVYYAW